MRRLALLIAVGLWAGCPEQAPEAAPPDASASRAPEGLAPFRVVLGGSLHGETGPCACPNERLGGLARRATLVSRARAEGPTLHLDTGDSLHPEAGPPAAPEAAADRARRMLAALAHMDLAAMAVQPRDLALGLEALTGAAEAAGVPLLSANLRQAGAAPFPAARVVTVAGQRVALVGVSAPDPGAYRRHGLSLAPAGPAIQAALQGLEAVDRVLVLGVLSPGEARALAEAVPEVDLVLTSGTGRQAERAGVLAEARAWRYATGDRGQHLMSLEVSPGEGPLVDAREARSREEARRLQEARLARLEARLAQATEAERPGMTRTLEAARRALGAMPPALAGQAWVEAHLLRVAEDVPRDPAVAALVGDGDAGACEAPGDGGTCR